MRSFISTIAATVAVGLLAACSGNTGSPSAALPSTGAQGRFVSLTPLDKQGAGLPNPDATPTPTPLFVANETGNDVTAYDHDLTPLPALTISGLGGPDSLALDGSNNLYVSNRAANDVSRYSGTTLIQTISSFRNCPIKNPVAVAVDPSGSYIFLASAGATSVNAYYLGGTHCQKLGTNIGNPQALAYVAKTGALFVASASTTKYPKGTVTEWTGVPPSMTLKNTFTTNIDHPKALASDSLGNVYVANDLKTGTVFEYLAPTYSSSKQWSVGQPFFKSPNALAVDLTGNLYVSSPGNNTVVAVEPPNGATVYKTLLVGIKNPVSLAIAPTLGWLRVANNYVSGKTVKGSVTEYCPASTCTTPSNETESGISGPASLVMGP